jgi:hypothetical protein
MLSFSMSLSLQVLTLQEKAAAFRFQPLDFLF